MTGRAVTAALLIVAACGGSDGVGGEPVTRGDARTLGTIDRELADDDLGQARRALARDAWRREQRFRDAVDPGWLFRSTRVHQAEIEAGLWTVDEVFQLGGQLFALSLTTADGFGDSDALQIRPVHAGARGGPDATSCTSCHFRGGRAGAGGAVDNALLRGDGVTEATAVPRNPPALLGAGIRQRLAEEITGELAALRDEGLAQAADGKDPVTVDLVAKGIDFGTIVARPDGTVDPDGVRGVDDDLVVRPFGWKGTRADIRDAVEDELLVHHGMVSEYLVEHGEPARVGSGGGDDPDGDAVTAEIIEGQLTALTFFLAMAEVPIERAPEDPYLLSQWGRGREDFVSLGCAQCHTPQLGLDDPRFELPSRADETGLRIDLSAVGAEPRLAADSQTGAFEVRLYSDLRRHAMGPALAEDRAEGGAAPDEFLTPPLWGVARSGPYLHDGRAATLTEAISEHGGEAQASRDAFVALDESARAPLRIFLTSLTRADRIRAD